ncbi:hypothetical protein [Bacillus sp. FJAT-49736]|uniref:hypothetical protein n=1 Tax=Bacillus sp. FJAT-49736 TaxID=2833582 RepID=UPI001BC97335|nr:hypothetical protein [Bacillus sp. FJAT-49736]MBS4173467.1 hypothetical protein [Bacillus sp. FJAT-49736]
MAATGVAGSAITAVANAMKPKDTKATTTQPTSQYDPSAVNSIYDKLVQAQTDAWNAQRDKAVGDINYQKQQVAPQYQTLRNQNDVTNLQNAKRLQELMASRGLGASGENVTATVNQNNARQNSLNALNMQEQQTINDFDHQIANLNNPAELNAMIAQLNAQRAQALYDDQWKTKEFDNSNYWNQKNFGLSEAGLTGKYNGQNTLAMNQYLSDKAFQEANLTGKYNGQDTLAMKQFNQQNLQWQKEFDQNVKQFDKNYALQQLQYELDKKVRLGQLSIDQAQLALAQARAKSSGSGGGVSSASAAAKASPPLANAYQQYQAEQNYGAKSNLDKYYEAQLNDIKKKTQAPYKNNVLKPVAPAQNKNLTDFEKLRLMGLM